MAIGLFPRQSLILVWTRLPGKIKREKVLSISSLLAIAVKNDAKSFSGLRGNLPLEARSLHNCEQGASLSRGLMLALLLAREDCDSGRQIGTPKYGRVVTTLPVI